MANTFVTPEAIARTSLGLLQRELVLPQTIWRDFDVEFTGKIGEFVNVRVPAVVAAREKDVDWDRSGGAITTDDVEETSFAVQLTKMPYSAVPITDEDMTLRIEDFGRQVALPQIRGIAEKVEGYIVSAMENGDYLAADLAVDEDDPYLTLVDARKALSDENVPRADRFVAVGSAVEAAILKSDRFKPLDNPIGVGAFAEAALGRIAGFTVVASNALDETEAYAYHRSAFILATRAPVVPTGAKIGAGQSYQGISMTWTQDYDPDYVQDRSVIRTFAGAQSVEDGGKVKRAVRLTLDASA